MVKSKKDISPYIPISGKPCSQIPWNLENQGPIKMKKISNFLSI